MSGADGVSETRWALKSEDNVLSWGGDEVGVGLCKQTENSPKCLEINCQKYQV